MLTAGRWRALALVAWLGCGGAAPRGAAAPNSFPAAAILGRTTADAAVRAHLDGLPTRDDAEGNRFWDLVGADFACELVGQRMAGSDAYQLRRLDCAKIAPGTRAITYAGGLPAGLTWTATEHAFRRAAYEAKANVALWVGDRSDADFGGRPMEGIDRFRFLLPGQPLPPPAPPTVPPTPTDAWWGQWLTFLQERDMVERDRRYVRVNVPAGTNLGQASFTIPTTANEPYAVLAQCEYVGVTGVRPTNAAATPRQNGGLVTVVGTGRVVWSGFYAGADQTTIELASQEASVHSRCAVWVFERRR